jgi:hypothetical protein
LLSSCTYFFWRFSWHVMLEGSIYNLYSEVSDISAYVQLYIRWLLFVHNIFYLLRRRFFPLIVNYQMLDKSCMTCTFSIEWRCVMGEQSLALVKEWAWTEAAFGQWRTCVVSKRAPGWGYSRDCGFLHILLGIFSVGHWVCTNYVGRNRLKNYIYGMLKRESSNVIIHL